jgi:hypothetical protein
VFTKAAKKPQTNTNGEMQTMEFSFNQPTTIRRLSVIALALGTFGTALSAAAQHQSFPAASSTITPIAGNVAYLEGHAVGTQGYTCLPTAEGSTSWTVNPAARPEATLFVTFLGQQVQIITHFASLNANPIDPSKPVPLSGNATWQSSLDTSKVWAVATAHIDAGTDASCPNDGAIPCLLLQAVGRQKGPTGGSILSKATFVQRLNTKGGAAPTTACSVGQTQLQPYSADYVFFRAEE